MTQQEFGQAVRNRVEERGQTLQWLADELGEKIGKRVPHNTLLTWLDRSVAPDVAFAIERILCAKPGSLTRLLGYLPPDAASSRSVTTAIKADPRLTEVGRRALLAAYREFVKG